MILGNYCDSVPNNLCVKIGYKELKRVEYCKYLGLYVDYNMKWDKHIEHIVNKTKYLLYVFAKFSSFIQPKILLIL